MRYSVSARDDEDAYKPQPICMDTVKGMLQSVRGDEKANRPEAVEMSEKEGKEKGEKEKDEKEKQEIDDMFMIDLEDIEQCLGQTWRATYKNRCAIYLTTTLVIWLCAGTMLYHFYYNWSYSVSFYYAVQAGLSVGFGALYEDDDETRGYTVFHVLVGSSFVGYILSVVIDKVMTSRQEWYEDELEEDILKEIEKKDNWVEKYYLRAQLWKKKNSYTFMISVFFFLWLLIGILLGLLHEKYSFIQSLYFAVTALSTGGLQAPSIDNEKLESWYFVVLGFWLLFGIPFYAAMLGAFAAGFVGDAFQARAEQELRKAQTAREFKAAISLSRRLQKEFTEKKKEKWNGVLVPLKKAKSRYKEDTDVKTAEEEMTRLYTQLDEQPLDWPAYLQMSLIRLGKTDVREIAEIRETFKTIDINGDGTFDMVELLAFNMMAKMDKNESFDVDVKELVRYTRRAFIPPTSTKRRKEWEKIFCDTSKFKIQTFDEAAEIIRTLAKHICSNLDVNGNEIKDVSSYRVRREKFLLAIKELLPSSINWLEDESQVEVELQAFRALIEKVGRDGSKQREAFLECMTEVRIKHRKRLHSLGLDPSDIKRRNAPTCIDVKRKLSNHLNHLEESDSHPPLAHSSSSPSLQKFDRMTFERPAVVRENPPSDTKFLVQKTDTSSNVETGKANYV